MIELAGARSSLLFVHVSFYSPLLLSLPSLHSTVPCTQTACMVICVPGTSGKESYCADPRILCFQNLVALDHQMNVAHLSYSAPLSYRFFSFWLSDAFIEWTSKSQATVTETQWIWTSKTLLRTVNSFFFSFFPFNFCHEPWSLLAFFTVLETQRQGLIIIISAAGFTHRSSFQSLWQQNDIWVLLPEHPPSQSQDFRAVTHDIPLVQLW